MERGTNANGQLVESSIGTTLFEPASEKCVDLPEAGQTSSVPIAPDFSTSLSFSPPNSSNSSIIEQESDGRLPEVDNSSIISHSQNENPDISSGESKNNENENQLVSKPSGHEASVTKGKVEGHDNNHYKTDITEFLVEIVKRDDGNLHLVDLSLRQRQASSYRGLVDTASPFESVKEAVSKLGGIVDWKAHKAKTLERRKQLQVELQKTQEEILVFKKNLEAAEDAKASVLKDLENTERLIEDLNLNLERALTEEAQAKQDSELAVLRLKEIEQGIGNDASTAAKAQVELTRQRHVAALRDLDNTKEELENLKVDYVYVIIERDITVEAAEEAVSISRDLEKSVDDLTLELIQSKELLESIHVAHLEAEEHRIGAALAREQDILNWEKELKQAKDELQNLDDKLTLTKDLKLKLDSASTLLANLKAELAEYMEAKLNEQNSDVKEPKRSHASVEASLNTSRKELEEVKADIEKAKAELNILRVAASSLSTEVEREKAALASLRQMEGMASIVVSSLEGELEKTKSEIEIVREKEKETREKMATLPKLLQQAAQEADQAKLDCELAHGDLRKAMEDAELAKSSSRTMEIRLNAVLKEIEATRASERLALAAVKALQESEQAAIMGLVEESGVTLKLEDYYKLSKEAHKAEEVAISRVKAAIEQIHEAKESEIRSVGELHKAKEDLARKEEELRIALDKSAKAKEGKLGVEQELRKWRAEHEKRRKTNDASPVSSTSIKASNSPTISFEESRELKSFVSAEAGSATDIVTRALPPSELKKYDAVVSNRVSSLPPEVKVRKKKLFFPRLFMFLARKKQAQKVK